MSNIVDYVKPTTTTTDTDLLYWPQSGPCPTCGRCPTCGHYGHIPTPLPQPYCPTINGTGTGDAQ